MRIVLDSNIIVAAYAARGLCNSLFELCLDRYDIIVSNYILDEVYKALLKKIKLPEDNVKIIIKYLKEFCIVANYKKIDDTICRDKKDNNIIALAVSNNAEYLITGDDDLLVLKKYNEIKILSPRDFWAFVKSGKK